jgi:hypothetical protein
MGNLSTTSGERRRSHRGVHEREDHREARTAPMSREEALPLVQFINRHDGRHQAEAMFLRGTGDAVDAWVLLTDRASGSPVASLGRMDDYIHRFAPPGTVIL